MSLLTPPPLQPTLLPKLASLGTARRIGRRPLFVVSSALVTFCLLMVGMAFANEWDTLVIFFWLCMFMFTFSLGLGPVTFVVASEVRFCEARASRWMLLRAWYSGISGVQVWLLRKQ